MDMTDTLISLLKYFLNYEAGSILILSIYTTTFFFIFESWEPKNKIIKKLIKNEILKHASLLPVLIIPLIFKDKNVCECSISSLNLAFIETLMSFLIGYSFFEVFFKKRFKENN